MSLVTPSCAQEETTDVCRHWGYHLLLDCKGCSTERVTNPKVLAEFVKFLIEAIDMKAYGEPILKHFAEHNPEVAGYSLLQLIETSSITGHFADLSGDSYIDIFSCKPFDIEKAKSVVELFLQPQKIRITFLHRHA
jgi:S-adenosylmethionine decarboxylase